MKEEIRKDSIPLMKWSYVNGVDKIGGYESSSIFLSIANSISSLISQFFFFG
jgi:hypothetical protein